MRLKSFTAKTMTEAMQMVRDTLGEDAVIVATREEDRGRSVRITAAVEPAFEVGRSGSDEDWLQYDSEDEEFAVAEELTEVMLQHAVPESVMDQILSCATVIGEANPGQALIASIEHLFHFRPLPVGPHNKAVMMIGPPGAGKTVAIAKMAARGVMKGLRVGVITTDTVRAGGAEQLGAFTKLLNITLNKAKSQQELSAVLDTMEDCDQVLIDTSGINPFDTEDIRALAKLVAAGDIDPILVLPAGTDAEESGEIARAVATVGVHAMVPTRLDIARRLGGLLSAAHHGNLGFADASNTPKVAEGLMPITPKTLSRLLMPAAYRDERAPAPRKTGTRQ